MEPRGVESHYFGEDLDVLQLYYFVNFFLASVLVISNLIKYKLTFSSILILWTISILKPSLVY